MSVSKELYVPLAFFSMNGCLYSEGCFLNVQNERGLLHSKRFAISSSSRKAIAARSVWSAKVPFRFGRSKSNLLNSVGLYILVMGSFAYATLFNTLNN
jgi:hypothetical protein